jgi:predicted dithiol-disulfide oxidoreductase (DUF899 family)
MSEPRYPNESQEYRGARDALLNDEQELINQVKAVAARRRQLPSGGELKEDYVFERANDGEVGQRVKFSELFGDNNTLILYSFMFGPNWDKPCPSCTSLVDGFGCFQLIVACGAIVRTLCKQPVRSQDNPSQPSGRPVFSRVPESPRIAASNRHQRSGCTCDP